MILLNDDIDYPKLARQERKAEEGRKRLRLDQSFDKVSAACGYCADSAGLLQIFGAPEKTKNTSPGRTGRGHDRRFGRQGKSLHRGVSDEFRELQQPRKRPSPLPSELAFNSDFGLCVGPAKTEVELGPAPEVQSSGAARQRAGTQLGPQSLPSARAAFESPRSRRGRKRDGSAESSQQQRYESWREWKWKCRGRHEWPKYRRQHGKAIGPKRGL